MLVGISVIELHLPGVRGLKHKRKIVKGLMERMHQRFRVSVVESDFHDLHQRAQIGVAFVARGEGEIANMMADLRRTVEDRGGAVITMWENQIVEAIG